MEVQLSGPGAPGVDQLSLILAQQLEQQRKDGPTQLTSLRCAHAVLFCSMQCSAVECASCPEHLSNPLSLPAHLPLRLTAAHVCRWLHSLVQLAPQQILPHTAQLLQAVLPCLGHSDSDIAAAARLVNADLLEKVQQQQQHWASGGGGGGGTAPAVELDSEALLAAVRYAAAADDIARLPFCMPGMIMWWMRCVACRAASSWRGRQR